MPTEVTIDIMGAILTLQRDIMFLRERVTKLERENTEYKKWRKDYAVSGDDKDKPWA